MFIDSMLLIIDGQSLCNVIFLSLILSLVSLSVICKLFEGVLYICVTVYSLFSHYVRLHTSNTSNVLHPRL